MAEPVIVACPEDKWTKVAAGVTAGVVRIVKGYQDSENCYQTYRLAAGGGPAPVDGVIGDGVPMAAQEMPIASTDLIDVYIMPTQKAIEVRVDL